jgi:hypothetical protein
VGKFRVLALLRLLPIGALILGGCLDPVEEVPELEEGGGALEEAAAPPVSRGGSPSLSGSNSKENPTKLHREEGIVKDGRPAPPIYPTAAPVPGKTGYCVNPFNNNILDVRGLPPGTLVLDPQDKIKGQKFRVSKDPKEEVAAEGESVVEDFPLEDQWGPEEENS